MSKSHLHDYYECVVNVILNACIVVVNSLNLAKLVVHIIRVDLINYNKRSFAVRYHFGHSTQSEVRGRCSRRSGNQLG